MKSKTKEELIVKFNLSLEGEDFTSNLPLRDYLFSDKNMTNLSDILLKLQSKLVIRNAIKNTLHFRINVNYSTQKAVVELPFSNFEKVLVFDVSDIIPNIKAPTLWEVNMCVERAVEQLAIDWVYDNCTYTIDCA